MSSIDIIKPLSTVLSNAINKSQQHQDKNSWECWKLNPELLGETQICCYLCSIQPPNYILIIVLNNGVLSRPTTWPATMSLQTQWSIDSIDVCPSENLLYLPTKLGPKSKKKQNKNFHYVRFRMSKIWDSENSVFLRPKSTFASNQLYSRHFGWGALSAEILG